MPSTIVGDISGGVPLISGNPWSGQKTSPTGIYMKVGATLTSGVFAYVAYSGGITVLSGGALASGGIRDGFQIAPGETIARRLPPGGPANIFANTPAATSGLRLFWDLY